MLENHDGSRGIAPGCQGVHAAYGGVAVDLVETCPADDGDLDRPCKRDMSVNGKLVMMAKPKALAR